MLLCFPATLGALPPSHLLSSIPLASPPIASGSETGSGQATTLPPTNPPTTAPLRSDWTATPLPVQSGGLILSPASAPFPRKLVDKVRSGQFTEMRELLTDNISLVQQLETMQSTHPVNMLGPTRPRLREVTTISTWLYCFLAYSAILTSDPKTRNHLAYARLIMREALRHGNPGWLDYDRSFRQQVAEDPSMQWNTLVPGLQASMILGYPARQGSATPRLSCTLCRGFDHTRTDCALTYLYPRAPQRFSHRQNLSCTSWNKGNCLFPGNCTFRHACATCQGPHKARDCPKTPDNSMYKQRRITSPTPAQSQP